MWLALMLFIRSKLLDHEVGFGYLKYDGWKERRIMRISLQKIFLSVSRVVGSVGVLWIVMTHNCSKAYRFSGGEAKIERTLAIIKPDGLFSNHTDAVKKIILESGFRIIKEKIVQLDQESAASFYAEHSARSFFHSLVQYMTSGPVLVMVLERDDAVSGWRTLIGPTDASKAKITHPLSIRAMCGTNAEKNCVHGSDSPRSAQREISFFFDTTPEGLQDVEHDEL